MTNREVFIKIFDNPLFEDWHCVTPCMGTPCASCEWWDEEYTSSEEKKPLFKIFITPPMGVTRAVVDLNMK